MFESKSARWGLLLYDIAEVRMGWEIGRLAIYQNKKHPRLVLNAKNLIFFYTSDTVQFSEDENLIFLKVFIRDEKSIEIPFVIIDLEGNMFSIVQMINSLPYSIHENLNCEFSLVEKYKDERFESYSGKIIDTNKLNWYPLDNIEEIIKIYIGVR